MKTLLFISLAVVIFACSKSEKAATVYGFNGFAYGTPADSVAYAFSFRPDKRNAHEIVYSDVTYEGVIRGTMTYTFSAGMLTGGQFMSDTNGKAAFDSLSVKMNAQYGKLTVNKPDIYLSRDKLPEIKNAEI